MCSIFISVRTAEIKAFTRLQTLSCNISGTIDLLWSRHLCISCPAKDVHRRGGKATIQANIHLGISYCT